MSDEAVFSFFLGGELFGETVLSHPAVASPEFPIGRRCCLPRLQNVASVVGSIYGVPTDDDPIAAKLLNGRHGMPLSRSICERIAIRQLRIALPLALSMQSSKAQTAVPSSIDRQVSERPRHMVTACVRCNSPATQLPPVQQERVADDADVRQSHGSCRHPGLQ